MTGVLFCFSGAPNHQLRARNLILQPLHKKQADAE
jgi:hypothetical protein